MSSQIANGLGEGYQFDFGLIVIIGSIIIGVIQLLMRCNIFGRSIECKLRNPNLIDKIMLKRVINDKLPKDKQHLATQIRSQLLSQCSSLSSESIQSILKEIPNER